MSTQFSVIGRGGSHLTLPLVLTTSDHLVSNAGFMLGTLSGATRASQGNNFTLCIQHSEYIIW